jgi:hypothetical protein
MICTFTQVFITCKINKHGTRQVINDKINQYGRKQQQVGKITEVSQQTDDSKKVQRSSTKQHEARQEIWLNIKIKNIIHLDEVQQKVINHAF